MGTTATGVLYAVCACCGDCDDQPLTTEIVTCRVCGAACSCAGCVAEAARAVSTEGGQ